MERRTFLTLSSVTALYVLTGCNSSSISSDNNTASTERLAFYGDTLNNRILEIDVGTMSLRKEIPTVGTNPYTIGRAGDENKLYAITRGSEALDVIDMMSMEIIKTMPMMHSPRSCAFNEYIDLQLISGTNKPMASLIDVKKDEVVSVVGRDILVDPLDYGGGNATGHPVWLNPEVFALLDREAREIILYKTAMHEGVWKSEKIFTLPTPTAPHHFVGKGADAMDNSIRVGDKETDTFYVVTEGTDYDTPGALIAPALLKLKFEHESLSIESSAMLQNDELGVHHATFSPDKQFIYLGSSVGKLFIINTDTMDIENTIVTGIGSGHTTFSVQKNLAIVTNHKDTFITIIDTKAQTKVTDIVVSGPSINDTILQSHTSFTDLEGNYFYACASDNGIFYELDLNTLKVSRTLKTGGTPKQGCSLLHDTISDEYMRVPPAY